MQKKYIFLCISLFFNIYAPEPTLVTIMLDPAGNTQDINRIVDHTNERSLTHSLCLSIKQKMESLHKDIRIIITHGYNDTIEPLQNASFSNRLQTNFYCAINIAQTKNSTPSLSLYYLQRTIHENLHTKNSDVSFIFYRDAHKDNLLTTKKVVSKAYNALQQDYARYFKINQPLGYPCAPLVGIQAPALCIEATIIKKDAIESLVAPFITILEAALNALKLDKVETL